MNMPKVLLTLTAANAVLLLFLLVQNLGLARADHAAPVLRGRALEIVDEQGRVRASIGVLPAARAADGTPQSETVLLRLITERGRPSVKIGASESTSGLSVAGPTGTRDTYVVVEARERTSSLRLRNEDGSERVLGP